MTTDASIPVMSPTLFEPGFNQDPFPLLEQIRALGPVVYNEVLEGYMVTGYRDVARILGDVAHYAQAQSDSFDSFFGGPTMETIDDKERHDSIRGIWAKDFRREDLESRRPLVEQVVAERLDPYVERLRSGEVLDAISLMTRSIPTLVIAHMLGIETEMFEQFSAWSDAMGGVTEGTLDPTGAGQVRVVAGQQATQELNAYIAEQVAARRRQPSDDLIGMMVHAPYAQAEMTELEIIASNTQLVFAGNETTAKLMAHTLVTLAAHPDQRAMLAEDRSLIPAAIEEVHRFQTIVQFTHRGVYNTQMDVQGVTLPKGSSAIVFQGAANRDPDRWPNAQAFDITREHRQHLGFGFGLHSCIGLNLARLEVSVWLNRLLDQVPDYQLAEPVDYGANFQLRGPVAVVLAA
jgi:cytochrome P450